MRRKNDKINCLNHALKAAEINPNNAAALDTLGTAYAYNNDQVNAEKCFLKGMNYSQILLLCIINLGNTQRHLGKYNDSILSFNNANKLDPNIIEIYTNLSLTFLKQSNIKAFEVLKFVKKL